MFGKIWQRVLRSRAPEAYARSIGVKLGKGCRLLDVDFSSEPYLITLGDRVSATRVRFETHDGGVWVARSAHPQIDMVKPIVVGSNVFLGYGAIVMPGVTIGDNVVIGAGAVVTRDIPANSVAVGVPARVIRSTGAYIADALTRGESTKAMTRREKKAFYEAKYRPEP